MMDLSVLDFILLNITSYLLGIGTGLSICCKYKDTIMKSRSTEALHNIVNDGLNHQRQVIQQPNWDSPVMASAPPPEKVPVKLTIQ